MAGAAGFARIRPLSPGPPAPYNWGMRIRPFIKGILISPLLVLLSLSGCGGRGKAPGAPRHVIVIVSDALRADHLGVYGYPRNTSPFIDQLAGEGVLFERALSNSSFTGESISSLFTGKLPSATPWGSGWEARPDPAVAGLGTLFRSQGYATALFSNSPMLDHPQFYRGFEETACFTKYGISQIAPRLVERALAFARKRAGERSLMYLHFIDPHGPYGPPEAYYRRFADSLYPDPLNVTRDVRLRLPELVAEGFGPGDPRFEDMVTRYDGEIAYVDDHLRQLFDGLRALGTLDDTLVIFTSDHGEEFLDHGFVEHAWQLYPESLHVPLLFWWPGHLPARRESGWVSLVDVLPSMLRLADIEPGRDDFDGTPLFAWGDGGWRVIPRDKAIISELMIQTRSMIRSVVYDDYQYLAYWKQLNAEGLSEAARNQGAWRDALDRGETAPLDPWGPLAGEELLRLGPDTKGNPVVYATPPEALVRLRAILKAYRERCPTPLPDAFKARGDLSGVDPETREKLEALGYSGTQAPKRDEAPRTETEERLEGLGYL